MRISAVIGKNFGDEGKGLVTASLSLSYKKPLIIKTNGGAQAGHTVENPEKGTRFIHHQTGSGSEYGATTLWSETYHPDLYKLEEEVEGLKSAFGRLPVIFAEPNTEITTIDDILINMAIENKRGEARHGSCGMGIHECCKRGAAGFGLPIADVFRLSESELFDRLKANRKDYSYRRIDDLKLALDGEHLSLFSDNNVLANYASAIKANTCYIKLTEAGTSFLNCYDGLIFENGQGLLLDEENEKFYPHVTASRTGLTEPMHFLKKRGLELDEVLYITRPYVTRHGAGLLPCECDRGELLGVGIDKTNQTNKWQGSIRYAKHENKESFLHPIYDDIKSSGCKIKPSLAITHIDETNEKIYFENKTLNKEEFLNSFSDKFEKIYFSKNHESISL